MLCRAVDSHNSYVWTSRIFIFCARKIQKSMQIDIDPLERCRHSADTRPGMRAMVLPSIGLAV